MAPATAVSGVTVEQYAGITAALAEDLPLDTVLAYEGLSPRTWKPVEVAWKLRLATEGVLAPVFQVFVERRAEAEDWLSRRIAPLEDDLGAWLAFLNTWSRHAAPFDMLVTAGLRLSDVSRLQRRWARRFAEERALEARAAEILRKGPGPLPAITAGEIDHKPFRWSRVGAPTKEPAGAPRTESPAPEVTPALLPVAAPELVVPSFMKVREPAAAPVPSRSPVAPQPAAPSTPARVPFGGTADVDLSKLGVPLPFAGKAPEEVAVSRAKAAEGASSRPASSMPVAQQGMTGDVPADLVRRIAKGPLPFPNKAPPPAAPTHSPPAPPAPSSPAPAAPFGGTVDVDLSKLGVPLPFAAKAPVAAGPREPAARKPPAPPPAKMTGETMDLPAGLVARIAAARPLPFATKDPSPPAPPTLAPAPPERPAARLTLEQYASLRAELTVFADRGAAVLARYGLADPKVRAAEEGAWEERLRRRPEERARLAQLCQSYVRHLRGAPPPSK